MPYYSDELIEEVRSRNDIVDVIADRLYIKLCIFVRNIMMPNPTVNCSSSIK